MAPMRICVTGAGGFIGVGLGVIFVGHETIAARAGAADRVVRFLEVAEHCLGWPALRRLAASAGGQLLEAIVDVIERGLVGVRG